MRRVLNLLAAAALSIAFATATTQASELNATDPNPLHRIPVPIAKHVLPPQHAMHVSLDVLVDGKPTRLIFHNGKLYLPVPRMGCEYEIRVNNTGSRRIAAVVSVDGLSVIKGEVASDRSPGYLVDSRSNVVIKGWRRDKNTVAAFTFEEPKNSYAYLRGYRDNIGVIGLVAIEEEAFRPIDPRMEFYRRLPPASNNDNALGKTGTGWGRDIGSSVVTVPFVRSNNKQTVTIYYDTPEALRRIGVPVDTVFPKPFPGNNEFCPPPVTGIR